MKIKFRKDNREKYWKIEEAIIQKQVKKKDEKFVLSGPWKKFIKSQHGLKIYSVDGEWMRYNIMWWWGHGGHGYVCEYIPLDEIWISDTHPEKCKCKNVKKNRELSQRYFESTLYHESLERNLMEKGIIYWKAHQIALDLEKKLELIKTGYFENYSELTTAEKKSTKEIFKSYSRAWKLK
jgi:hypothetical protein